MIVNVSPFGKLMNKNIDLISIDNENGQIVQITNFGGIIHSWRCPDKRGKIAEILLGCYDLDSYISGHPYFGAIVGRFGNRISDARFKIGDITYHLAANLNGHHLHGGIEGFDKKIWDYQINQSAERVEIILHYMSPHLEEGYPGNLDVTVTYVFDINGALTIYYSAFTDRPTHINLTNHCYFNLSGDPEKSVLNHDLFISADYILETDADLIPTGKLFKVQNTAFDFRQFHRIGERIFDADELLRIANGYDHNYVLNRNEQDWSVILADSESGRVLKVSTSEPGMQLYTGNWLDGVAGRNGPIRKYHAVCLETQHFPNSPNRPEFPSTLLKPDFVYKSKTVYQMCLTR